MDTFLGMALTDPATGLPNLPYFCLIQDWEERRAQRRKTVVRVLHLHVLSGSDVVRRTLMVRICQEVRTSDLIASDGRDEFRILLTSPDAEQAEGIAERIEQLATTLNQPPTNGEAELQLRVRIEAPHHVDAERGPCDPCDQHIMFNTTQFSSSSRSAK